MTKKNLTIAETNALHALLDGRSSLTPSTLLNAHSFTHPNEE